ncbi:Hsp20/alpha crystallin family protein [Actinoalloteichus hymeniacidonis]|uniref:Molecular chaperone (Small heat shock protein) n=1 Tax=Actinoalloteichus hymeniacidonis TaxID=340345 RepID=A0AAC9HKG1_9PSEU|nr:Hsp20/alpha crystallin family protein [Actinoalloteichus hymeniacidonis]AOS60967.1 molecular chaperone (small heat shock protein) [Actinoalloteichus hymeniacidonis]MBB5911033.1 HSP20 family protein [Actinoalloteichus hymeniacidonis]
MAIITRRVGWEPLRGLNREFDASFDALVSKAFGPQVRRPAGFTPAADVSRDGDDVLITLELPGVDIDSDVTVEVLEGTLRISGSRREEREVAAGDRIAREIRGGEFRREFTIPDHVTPEAIEASYDRGLLQIRVNRVVRPAPTPTKVAVRQGAAAPARPTTVEGASAESDSTES